MADQPLVVPQSIQPVVLPQLAPAIKTVAPQQNLYQQALTMYPKLNDFPVMYKESFTTDKKKPFLEFYPTQETMRPTEFPIDKFGVEVFRKNTKPTDIAADIVSHGMVKSDETLKKIYTDFAASLNNPKQQARLKEQYAYAVKNEGEKRPYDKWLEMSGLPAYFRGYAFKQWDQKFVDKAYTPAQKKMLDDAIDYLKGKKQNGGF